jgi:deoxyribodipyrimidine photolyase-related protein
MRDGKPEGGKFRFDTENRKPVGSDVKLPNWTNELADRQSKFIKTAYTEIASDGKSLGEWAGDLVFPTTRSGCREALRKFVTTRLKQFGPYQDAIVENDDFLFHSVLSAPINAGLLTPADIISEALKHKASVPLQSLEGFLAQVIGWREFMRAVYYKYPTAPTNRLKHSRRLSEAWYNANTGLLPLDTAISRVNENAYLHHIERLMIVGNAMFLTQIHPDDCYRWFMEMFADSYDWVMIGNVYYMSQWASDAITTKPYISSSAYIRRMSDYKASDGGEWVKEWDALYWNAVHKHGDLLRKNYRMAAQVSFFQKKSDSDKSLIKSVAGTVIKRITRA